jgi:hypothetical protein
MWKVPVRLRAGALAVIINVFFLVAHILRDQAEKSGIKQRTNQEEESTQ